VTIDDSSPQPAPPGRQRLSPEQRRRQLIEATIRVVAQRGYANASLTAIAGAAGVAKGLLWHYFTDGDDLMEQAARTTLVTLREAVAEDIDLTAPVPTVIRAAVARAARLRETHAEQLLAMREIVQNLRTADGLPLLGITDYDETYARQAALFRRGQEEGTLRAHDADVVAVTYQGAVDAMLAYLDQHPSVDGARYADAVADVLLAGIATST